jgi:MFS family permease
LLSAPHRKLSIAIYTTIALIAFEGTSVGAALPELAADLGDVDLLPWIITGFLFALGLTTVVAGPLVDALGSRVLFGWSAAVFAGTGFLAGLSTNLTMMIVIRLIQGGASGVLFAATIAAVNLGFPDRLTGRAFAANSTIWGITGAAAPAIAAAMLSIASWRWIFFINLPLGVLAIAAGRSTMPERQPDAEPASIDWRGAALAGVFTLASIAAVDQLGWSSIAFGALGVGAVVAYGRHARRTDRPVVSLKHIAVQPYRSLALVPALMLGAAFTTSLYVTVYVAAGRGFSNGAAAWSVVFFTIGWTLGANLATPLLDRRSPTSVMTSGMAVSIAGLALESVAVGLDAPLVVVFAGLLLLGVGIGLTTNASLVELRAATPPAQIGRASAANQFARSQGFTLGSAAGGAILLFVVNRRLGSVEPVRRLLAGDDVGAGPDIADAVRAGFTAVSITSVVVVLLAVPPMLSLRRHAARASTPLEVASTSS